MSLRAEPPRKPRLFVVLGVLVLVGLPLVVAGSLLRKGLSMARSGAQPGGEIEGRVHDRAGAPLEGVSVECYVVLDLPTSAVSGAQATPPASSSGSHVAATETGPDGSFRCALPATTGLYRVYVGGGDWLRVGVDHSFIGRGDGSEGLEPLQFELEPGCTLEAHFEHAGAPVTGGVLNLTRRRAWYDLSNPLRIQRPFEGGTLTIDGLPAMTADVHVRFNSGAELSFEVDLEPGVKVSRFTL